jgi:hypothetical protein
VPGARLELATPITELRPERSVYTNFTIRAEWFLFPLLKHVASLAPRAWGLFILTSSSLLKLPNLRIFLDIFNLTKYVKSSEIPLPTSPNCVASSSARGGEIKKNRYFGDKFSPLRTLECTKGIAVTSPPLWRRGKGWCEFYNRPPLSPLLKKGGDVTLAIKKCV